MKLDSKQAISVAQDIFLLGEAIEEYTAKDLINLLQVADDLYHNGKESFLTDEEYDIVRKYAASNSSAPCSASNRSSMTRGNGEDRPLSGMLFCACLSSGQSSRLWQA